MRMIPCDECELAEMTPWKRRLVKLDRFLFGTPIHVVMQLQGRLLRAGFMGETMQMRHAKEYIKTGDKRELERSLRHVEKAD